MKLTFIAALSFVILTASSFITSAKDRWVKDQGGTSIEVVVTEKSPTNPPPVIVVSTNSAVPVTVTVTTNRVPNVVVYQQTNWPVKVNASAGFEKPVEYKATVAKVQEPRQKKGFFGRFFGPSQPMMTDAVSQSSLPANPVRRRSLDFTMMNGSYNYHHSQGTRTYVRKSWGEYGPEVEAEQSTHMNTSESFYPERRRWIAPTYYQQYQGSQGTVSWP